MFIRVGEFVVYPHMLLLPFAAAFFVVVGYRRVGSLGALFFSASGALVGAFLHGRLGGLGSFGAYWGALAGAWVWASAGRRDSLWALNGMAGAVLAGGAVARVGCLFTGCCHGAAGSILYHGWAAMDGAALVGVLGLGVFLERRRAGGMLLSFLLAYGAARFFLEFWRVAPGVVWGLTEGQVLGLGQVVVGGMWTWWTWWTGSGDGGK